LEMCFGSLDHLDNCKSFGAFNIFKSMLKIVVFSCRYEVTVRNDD